MKTFGFLAVAGLTLYGQVPDMPMSGWANLSAVALLGLILWSILMKQQPKERREAREHVERVVKQIGDDNKATQQQQHKDQMALLQTLRNGK